MSDATTPIGETNPKVPDLPSKEGGLQTYEDCLILLNGIKDEKDPAKLLAGHNKLISFFNTRVGKRKSEGEKDGSAAVKRLMTTERTFKPYEARPITAAPTNNDKLWGA